MTSTKISKDDALRAAVADLPKLPWLADDFVESDCRIGDDHDGYPSIWIRLIAKDETIERPGYFREFDGIRLRIRDHLRDVDLLGDRWAYFDLDAVSDRREMYAEGDE
jgi:hypothetical protein